MSKTKRDIEIFACNLTDFLIMLSVVPKLRYHAGHAQYKYVFIQALQSKRLREDKVKLLFLCKEKNLQSRVK